MTDAHRFETRAIHVGQEPDPATGAVVVPIYQTSTFKQEDPTVRGEYIYSRAGNPTRSALEACLASLEGGTQALAFASGMGAISTVMYLLPPGDHVLAPDDVYGGTYRLLHHVLAERGLEFSFVDMTDLDATAKAIQPNTRMIWLESPSNPLLKVIDIAAVTELARQHDALSVVDNTFASPYLQRPLELGADLVVHSTTKYLGGHSDVIGGAVVASSPELYERLRFLAGAVGATPSPFDCWLVLRGIRTLAIRMEAHCRNAMALARFLESHPRVERVYYPGLESHPQHEIARRQMADFGGMLAFEVVGGAEAARHVVQRTQLFTLAVSLGGVESLIEVPYAMTHLSTQGSALEPSPGLIRVSAGIEHPDDLVADLDQALGMRDER